MTRRLLPIAALAVSTALLLTACGGEEAPDRPDEIAGADDGKKSSSPTADPPPGGAPEFDLPADLKVDIEEPAADDPADGELLRDVNHSIMALNEAYAKLDGTTPMMTRYFTGRAGAYWAEDIAGFKKNGRTITGDLRYYAQDILSRDKDSASVTYCEDQRKSYAKEVKSGKVHRTKPSNDDILYHRVELTKEAGKNWMVSGAQWVKGEKKCVSG